jgi:hypothetical protein
MPLYPIDNNEFLRNLLIRARRGHVTPAVNQWRLIMDLALGFLTFGTLGFVAVFGYLQSRAMEERMRRGGPKSSLSRDGAAERLAALRTSETNGQS